MSLKSGKPKIVRSAPPDERKRELREAVVEGTDKTEGKERDLMHGDGGTHGLDVGEDMNKHD